MLFEDKTALVTGGTRGIGKAIVLELISQGARVAFTYHRSANVAVELVQYIEEHGGRALAFEADVRIFARAREVVESTKKKFGGLDILVNNAGLVKDKVLMLTSPDDWGEVIDTNLKGIFNYSRSAIVTFMKQKRGNILNISSVSGLVGIAGQTSYAASKMGAVGFTRALAKEIASLGINVNALAPGFVETELVQSLRPEVRKEAINLVPQGRFCSPDEVAKVASFLLSDQARYITGQVIVMDGGFSL